MFDKVMQFISSKYLKFTDDEIWFGKDRMIIYTLGWVVNQIHMNQKLFGTDYAASIYLSSKKQGIELIKTHITPMKKLLNPIVKLSSDLANAFGFIAIRSLKINHERTLMIISGRSSVAELYKKTFGSSDSPIDSVLSGVFAGAMACFSEKPIYGVELECSAQDGVGECTWAIGDIESVLNYTKKLFPARVEYAGKILELLQKTEKADLEGKSEKVF